MGVAIVECTALSSIKTLGWHVIGNWLISMGTYCLSEITMQEAVTQLSKVSELFILTALSFCFLPFMSHTVQHMNNTTMHRNPLRSSTKNIQHVFVTTVLQKFARHIYRTSSMPPCSQSTLTPFVVFGHGYPDTIRCSALSHSTPGNNSIEPAYRDQRSRGSSVWSRVKWSGVSTLTPILFPKLTKSKS